MTISRVDLHSTYRNAITEVDGISVNIGYLVLYRFMVATLTVMALMCAMAVYACYSDPNDIKAIILALGQGIGLAVGAFGAPLLATAGFLYGDRHTGVTPAPGSTITTVDATRSTITTAAPEGGDHG